MSNTPTQIEEDEVRVAVRGLLRQANMYSMSHLQDPTSNINFGRSIVFLANAY